MNCRMTVLSLFVLLGLAGAAFGQVKLERKLLENRMIDTESSVLIDQKLTIGGMQVDSLAENRATHRTTFGKRDGEGKLVAEQKTTGLKARVQVQGQEYRFDSEKPDDAGTSVLEANRGIHKAVAKMVIKLTHDKNGNIVSVEPDPGVLNSLTDDQRKLAQDQLDPENMKREANEELMRIPDAAVKPGDTWERSSQANLGAGQMMTFQTEYKYEGVVEKDNRKLDKISLKNKGLKFTIENSPLGLGLKESNLKVTESEGHLLFDRTYGGIAESKSSVRIQGTLTLTINNMELPSTLDLKMESESVSKLAK